MVSIFQLLMMGLISVGIAAAISFAIFHKPLRAAFVTIVVSVARMRRKYRQKCDNMNLPLKQKPSIYDEISGLRIPRVNNPRLDIQTAKAANALLQLMHESFGKNVTGIYLFGSRARSDFSRFSDMDIAIRFLPGFDIKKSTLFRLIHISFMLLVQHAIYVQIRILRPNLDYLNPSIIQEGVILLDINHQGLVISPTPFSGEI